MNYKYTMEFTNGLFSGAPSIRMDDDANEIPANIIIIDTVEELNTYLIAYNTGLKNIVLVDGEIQIVDKYTLEELTAKQAAEESEQLIGQAKALLTASDYRVLPDRFAEFATEEQSELVEYRAQLRLVARKQSNILPTPPVFI